MSYSLDRQWSDRFIPEIRRIVGPHLLTPSSFEVDTQEAADLVVLKARDMTIACRVRRPGYAARYPSQFTIRSHRDSGAKTELQKIVDGWGDWFFYGHSTENEKGLELWHLLDLSAWRAHMIRNKGAIQKGQQPNGDGTHFTWFDINSFPANPPIVVASSKAEMKKEAA